MITHLVDFLVGRDVFTRLSPRDRRTAVTVAGYLHWTIWNEECDEFERGRDSGQTSTVGHLRPAFTELYHHNEDLDGGVFGLHT